MKNSEAADNNIVNNILTCGIVTVVTNKNSLTNYIQYYFNMVLHKSWDILYSELRGHVHIVTVLCCL